MVADALLLETARKAMSYTARVGLYRADEAAYLQSRSARYAGIDRLDRMFAVRRQVLVVIAYRDLDGDLHGMDAWPASGRDLATYLKEGEEGEES